MERPGGLTALWLRFCAAVLALLPLSFVFRGVPTLFFKPLTEDGFYSLSVARNLALGHGLTIDGHQITNGFQPLMTLVDSVAFLDHGNRVVGVRGILVISWLVMLATCVLAGLIARDMTTSPRSRALAFWLAVDVVLSGRYVLYAFNGLETGAVMLMVVVLWRWYQTREIDTVARASGLGALLGVAVLVRIDAVALLLVMCVALVWRARSTRSLVLSATVALSALVVSAPWWIYNQVAFGHLMPTSGRAEESVRFTLSRFSSMVIGVAQDVIPWGYTAKTQTYVFSLVEIVLVGAAVVWLWRRPVTRELAASLDERSQRGRRFAVQVAVSLALLAGFYYVETSSVWFYGRYLAPAVVLSSVGVTTLLLNRRFDSRILLSVIAGAMLVIGLAFSFHFDRHATSPYYQDQLTLIDAHVPPGVDVAAGQSGTIGFMRDDVVNLDGKVNPKALAHEGHIRQYLADAGIRWLCDQPVYVDRYLSDDPARYGWVEVASLHGFELWHHVKAM